MIVQPGRAPPHSPSMSPSETLLWGLIEVCNVGVLRILFGTPAGGV